MTSYYVQIPTLAMRARAAPLIVLGRLGKTLRSDIEQHEGRSYVRTTYEVLVERVFKGRSTEATIAVQVLGGEAAPDAAPRPWVVPEGGQVLLMLSEGLVAQSYVPYLGSAFPLGTDGHLQLGEHAAEKIGLLGAAKADRRGISLEAVAELIDEAVREEASAPPRSEAMPLPVLEMPVGHEGGGQHAEPGPLERDSS